jgi:hypothetical protein
VRYDPTVRHSIALGRASAAVLLLATLGVAAYLAPGWQTWANPATLAVSAALAVALIAAAVSLWRGTERRRLVGAALLFGGTVLLVLEAVGFSWGAPLLGPAAYELSLAAATAGAALGVLFHRRGARWLAIGLGAAGSASSAINLGQWMMAGVCDHHAWAFAVWAVGGFALVATLTGRDIAAQDRIGPREQVWTRPDPAVRWMRAATISAIVATPMLLLYAFVQPGAVGALTTPAGTLAGFLAAAAFLSARGQVMGGLLLALGAVALAALSIAAFVLASPGDGTRIAGYYIVFWLPAAACGIAGGIALARLARTESAPRLLPPG